MARSVVPEPELELVAPVAVMPVLTAAAVAAAERQEQPWHRCRPDARSAGSATSRWACAAAVSVLL